MIEQVKISVVMAAYNAEKFIAEAIQSVLDQTFTRFELIIVNDGSSDSTGEIISSFHDPRITYIQQHNRGLAAALNEGLHRASGEYIARFDADDICYPQRLEKQYLFIKENPSYAIVGSVADYIDQEGEFIFTYRPEAMTREEIEATKRDSCPFIHSSVMYRKNIVLEKGGYNQQAHSFEDHLLWLDVLEKCKGLNLPDSLIQVRLNPASVTIDETWRPKAFHRIKTKALHQQHITNKEGEALLNIIQQQNIKKVKEGAYHALLAKKFLWNNYQPAKSRKYLKKVLSQHPFHWQSYSLYLLSFMPPAILRQGYKLFKSKPIRFVRPLCKEVLGSSIRLFVDAHFLDKEHQGVRTFINGIYTCLAQEKDIHLFIGSANNNRARKLFPPADNITFIQYKSSSIFLRLAIDIPLIIRKYKMHYAHFQYLSPFIKNCKQIVTIHDVLFKEYPRQFPASYRLIRSILFKRSAHGADILTTVSSYSKLSIQKHFGIKAKNIHVIPNGINEVFFQPYDKKEAKAFIKQKFGFENFILFVSRFEPRKNHHLLLKAFLQLKLYEKGYHLVLLGHSSIPVPAFINLLASVPVEIKKYIFISEKIFDEELLQFYQAADVFVYPSLAEGFGIPPLEAAAAAVPVICANTTAMTDYHFFGKNSIDPLDEEALKTRLKKCLEEVPDAEGLAAISKKIRQNYSWRKAAEDLYSLIKENHQSATSPIQTNKENTMIKRLSVEEYSFEIAKINDQ